MTNPLWNAFWPDDDSPFDDGTEDCEFEDFEDDDDDEDEDEDEDDDGLLDSFDDFDEEGDET